MPVSCESLTSSRIHNFQSQLMAIELSFQKCTEQFYTLESTPATTGYAIYNSHSTLTISSNRSPFSLQSFDAAYNSPLSSSSTFNDENKLMSALWVLRNQLLGPESDLDYNSSLNATRYNNIVQIAPHMNLKQLLVACAKAISAPHTWKL